MLRNHLATALRNLARNKFYAGITVLGLSLGFAAAILIALFVRDEFGYDRFIPGYQDAYLVTIRFKTPTTAWSNSNNTEVWTAPLLKAQFPEIQDATRLAKAYFPPLVQRGQVKIAEQQFMWADPNVFRVLPLPVLAGDLQTALDTPDGLVLTRAMARKYFGADAPLGATLLIDGHPMRVTAVIRDLPSNTHLIGDVFGSGLAAFSGLKTREQINGVGDFSHNTWTYVRLKPGTPPGSIEQRLPRFLSTRMPIQPALEASAGKLDQSLHLLPLSDIHLWPTNSGSMKPGGDRQVIAAIALVGVLIVAIAAINFVTLMTARANRRAVEVGVRKAMGARRRDLIFQFLGEAMLYVLLSMVVAVSLAELLLPAANGLLQRTMAFNYVGDPSLAAAILGVALIVGLLAGLYPAFILSAFRPAAVLKGGRSAGGGSPWVRQGLVVAQFAVLVGLIIVTVTVARQTWFAINDSLRVDKAQVLLAGVSPCTDNFRDRVRALPGVKAAACASAFVLNFSDSFDAVRVGDHSANIDSAGVDFGFFEVFGVKPLAGRLFQQDRPTDDLHADPAATTSIVLNESAVRKLGFATPEAAIGQTAYWHGPVRLAQNNRGYGPAQIIGVVPDFSFSGPRTAIPPSFYYIGPKEAAISMALVAKLDGRRIPETLAGIDRIWADVGDGKPIIKAFVDQLMALRLLDSLIQGAVIAICAGLALFIACLGLFALSAYTAEQRTKEIGVRKAMGAGTGDILRLLVWQFTKPVLWANLIAWPIGWWLMDRWLSGFAYHVDLNPLTFVFAAAAAVLIAWATVAGQAYLVARSKPVAALRYE
jgi:putative ABC transport system permease protein